MQNFIIPAQAPHFKSEEEEFIFNQELYSKNKFYGEELFQIEIIGKLREVRLARITFCPVRYNPVENKLKVLY